MRPLDFALLWRRIKSLPEEDEHAAFALWLARELKSPQLEIYEKEEQP